MCLFALQLSWSQGQHDGAKLLLHAMREPWVFYVTRHGQGALRLEGCCMDAGLRL